MAAIVGRKREHLWKRRHGVHRANSLRARATYLNRGGVLAYIEDCP